MFKTLVIANLTLMSANLWAGLVFTFTETSAGVQLNVTGGLDSQALASWNDGGPSASQQDSQNPPLATVAGTQNTLVGPNSVGMPQATTFYNFIGIYSEPFPGGTVVPPIFPDAIRRMNFFEQPSPFTIASEPFYFETRVSGGVGGITVSNNLLDSTVDIAVLAPGATLADFGLEVGDWNDIYIQDFASFGGVPVSGQFEPVSFIVAVPEPSVVLLSFGGLAFLTRRRREF